MNKQLRLAVLLGAALALTACANGGPNRTAIGAGIGSVAGAVIGHQLGDNSSTNTAVGAIVGGLAGGAVGRYMDNQQQELQDQLRAEQAADILSIQRLGDNSLLIGIASDASFAVDSSTLSSRAQGIFNKIANILREYNNTAVHVVGHTDSSGAASYNMKLSLERSRSVAGFLVNRGVNSKRVLTWGRGENEPIASNSTKAGRAKNRRVDIVLKPIVQGNESAAFTAPPYLGQ